MTGTRSWLVLLLLFGCCFDISSKKFGDEKCCIRHHQVGYLGQVSTGACRKNLSTFAVRQTSIKLMNCSWHGIQPVALYSHLTNKLHTHIDHHDSSNVLCDDGCCWCCWCCCCMTDFNLVPSLIFFTTLKMYRLF